MMQYVFTLMFKFIQCMKRPTFMSSLLFVGCVFVAVSLITMSILHSLTSSENFKAVEGIGKGKMAGIGKRKVPHIHLVRDQVEIDFEVMPPHRKSAADAMKVLDKIEAQLPGETLRKAGHSKRHNPQHSLHHSASGDLTTMRTHLKRNHTYYKKFSTHAPPAFYPVLPNLSPIKGYYVNYSNQYGDLITSGTYFQYIHNYSTPCYLNTISLKYDPICDEQLSKKQVRQLLVVAVQRSGTHFTWEMLNRLNVTVHHEGVGIHGSVSWPYSVRSISTKRNQTTSAKTTLGFSRSYIINNPEKLKLQRFRHVFHQVRHPLRVISTLMSRCYNFDKFWSWIGRIKLQHFNEINKLATPMTRAMLLYYYWNRHIESYADIRFQSETTSPRDICKWAQFDNDFYCNRAVTLVGEDKLDSSRNSEDGSRRLSSESEEEEKEGEENKTDDTNNSSSSTIQDHHLLESNDHLPLNITYLNVSWADLDAENITLSAWIKDMCLEYGFPLDPDLIPQNKLSRQFTA